MNITKSNKELTANILVVDDTSSNLRVLSRLLQDEGYAVRIALDGPTAITIAEAQWPDLILLDILMPEVDGYEVCNQLKASDKTRDIPVIFLSSLKDIFDKKKAFEVGGVDYIPKTGESEEVLIRIKNQLLIQASKGEIEQLNAELENRVKERTEELELANEKLQKEIAQRRKAEDKMLRKALQDPLTGLINRSSFFGKLTQSIQQFKKQPNAKFAVFLIDCDCFKNIKNAHGIVEATQLLIAIANRLISCFPRSSYIGRFEGDEFAILLYGVDEFKEVINIAKKTQKILASPFELKKSNVYANNSIGIVILNDKYQSIESILQDANIALQESKVKNIYQVFHPEMALTKSRNRTDANSQDQSYLKKAIENQEFIVYYQPVICLNTGRILELEALVHWNHPVYGLISSSQFIAVAETTGLIVELGYLVILKACQDMVYWQQEHQLKIQVSINLSPQQFKQPDLIQKLDQILDATGIEGKYLKLEIPEKAIADDPEASFTTMEKLESRQIQVIIDDFGKGYCHLNHIALTYLMNFPIKSVKINFKLSKKSNSNSGSIKSNWKKNSNTMFELLLDLANQMNLKVTVKNIESEEQLKYIKSLDCDYGQGFIISQPLKQDALAELLLWTT